MSMKQIESQNGKDTYQCEPINICFVGMRGTGKTSLLASLYKELQEKSVDHFFPEFKTRKRLSEKLTDMLSVFGTTEHIGVVAGALEATLTPQVHIFNAQYDVANTNKRFIFPFKFTDIPGEWYNVEEHQAEIKSYLTGSSISFLTIDAPALMEGGAIHNLYNGPMMIQDLYKEAHSNLKDKHLVVIVLSRCERFMQDSAKRKELYKKVEAGYGPFATSLRNNGVTVFSVAVQTLGGVIFRRYNDKNEPVFIKIGEYAPKNCATPLALALRHGMKAILAHLEVINGGWFQRFLNTIGWSQDDLAQKAAENILKDLETKITSNAEGATFEIGRS